MTSSAPARQGTAPNRNTETKQAGARIGISVATAGEVNGDGFADVIVGAPFYDNGQPLEGRVFVYHGSAAGNFYVIPTPSGQTTIIYLE